MLHNHAVMCNQVDLSSIDSSEGRDDNVGLLLGGIQHDKGADPRGKNQGRGKGSEGASPYKDGKASESDVPPRPSPPAVEVPPPPSPDNELPPPPPPPADVAPPDQEMEPFPSKK